jgi:hypothetical protein
MEQALLGDTRRARPLLGQAEATLPSQRSDDAAGLFVIWDESRFPGWAGKTLLILRDPAATGLLEQALAMTSAPHPRLGLLVDLAMALMNEGDADHAITLLVEGTQLAIERGIEGFARCGSRRGEADSRRPSSAPLTAGCTLLPRTLRVVEADSSRNRTLACY